MQRGFSFASVCVRACASLIWGRNSLFTYRIPDGHFKRDGLLLAADGYSGAGLTLAEGRNNASMVNIEGVGPIPPGRYRIMPPRDSKTLGPIVFDLVPMPGTNVFGRSLFRIHGNDKANNASHGCVILNHTVRESIAKYLAMMNDTANQNEEFDILEVLAA